MGIIFPTFNGLKWWFTEIFYAKPQLGVIFGKKKIMEKAENNPSLCHDCPIVRQLEKALEINKKLNQDRQAIVIPLATDYDKCLKECSGHEFS